MKIEIYPEICCDYCNDVIHNHMDCPVCNHQYAGTETYHDIIDWMEEGEPVIITCQECKAEFKATKTDGYYDEWEWEQVI